jgi:hypothetical protein
LLRIVRHDHLRVHIALSGVDAPHVLLSDLNATIDGANASPKRILVTVQADLLHLECFKFMSKRQFALQSMGFDDELDP